MRLTIAPYLQHWDHSARTLGVTLLIAPDGDPTTPLGPDLPSFADARLVVAPQLFSATDLPNATSTPVSMDAIPLIVPAHRDRAIEAINAAMKPTSGTGAPRATTYQVRKHLPDSYRNAFNFTAPRTDFATLDHTFDEAVRCADAFRSDRPTSTKTVRSWSEALAYVMRQPALMTAIGMRYELTLTIPADLSQGWLGFNLADGSAPGRGAHGLELQRFLTKIEDLPGDSSRPLFSAALFPSLDGSEASSSSSLDQALDECARLNDGFAQIVHAVQPTTEEEHQGKPGKQAPQSDLGIRLAWDDEDVIAGINRAVQRDTGVAKAGAAGYRVDVRIAGADDSWHSLCLVESDDLKIGPEYSLGRYRGELRVEVHPQRVNKTDFWVLPYYARWRGGSMVLREATDGYLRRVSNVSDGSNSLYRPVDSGVRLRYGNTYEFRVRMVDATGGGPSVGHEPVTPGPAPTASVHFRRFVPIGKVGVDSSRANHLMVSRPLLDYPAVIYATDAAKVHAALESLKALRSANKATRLPDPDATALRIRVLVKNPAFDPAGDGEGYRELYTTERTFPENPGHALNVPLQYFDAAQVDTTPSLSDWAAARSGPLHLPTARDVRIEFRALGSDPEHQYFGADTALLGRPAVHDLKRSATTEHALFVANLGSASSLRAVYSRNPQAPSTAKTLAIPEQSHPTQEVVSRLAEALRLRATGSTLIGPAGQRVVFGCAGAAHRLAPDNSSLTFLTLSELVGTWVCAVRVDIDRDWSWKDLADTGIHFTRTIRPRAPGASPDTKDLGEIQVLHSVGRTAIEVTPLRERTSIVFIDVFSPKGSDESLNELDVDYDVSATLQPAAGAITPRSVRHPTLSVRLPIVTPPSTRPKVLAAGHALSPFQASDDYSKTSPRQRMLWLELESPSDPRDAIFARVLTQTPDPLLLDDAEPAADPAAFPDLPIPDELVRLVVPGEGNDHAGLNAMQPLLSSDPGSDSATPPASRVYLVPLPPATHEGSPDLLGFYTYELRIGHSDAVWSTARGRYGPALVLKGVQHPPPALTCAAYWRGRALSGSEPAKTFDLVVTSGFAEPFYEGKSVQPSLPRTELWMVLYAQIRQADGKTWKNIQLDTRRGELVAKSQPAQARALWSTKDIRHSLDKLRIINMPSLSVITIETLPEPIARFSAPLTGDLGQVRVLRCSALTSVGPRPC